MTNLNTAEGRKELWKNSAPEDAGMLQNMNLDFDLDSGDVRIHSKQMEEGGEYPMFDWNMNTNTGVIEEITRKNGRERIVEREVNPDTLLLSDDFFGNIERPKGDIKPAKPTATVQKTEDAATAVTGATTALAAKTELGI